MWSRKQTILKPKIDKNSDIPVFLPFLSFLFLGFLGSSHHFASVTISSSWTSFDRSVFKRGRGYSNFTSTLQNNR